jgi:phosphatidylglycerophosphate synthase
MNVPNALTTLRIILSPGLALFASGTVPRHSSGCSWPWS